MFKIFKNKKIIVLVMTLLLIFNTSSLVFADDFDEEDPGLAERFLSSMFRNTAWGIDKLFFQDDGLSIDGLLYNTGADRSKDMGLTLLKGTELSKFFMEYYLTFQYMAIMLFIPIGLWTGIHFTRVENSQQRALLKEKFFRLFVTVILLTSMPEILDVLIMINGAVVDIFKAIGLDALGKGVMDKGFLLKTFKDRAWQNETLVDAIVYLMSVILNVWLVFFYFIRDITVCFLFSMFPIFAIFYPLDKGITIGWIREIASNIFGQGIQSMVFTGVLVMSIKGGTSFTGLMFTLTAFSMIIPMTAVIKRSLKLEGAIGAASSMAGLGALFGAMQLAQGTMRTAKQGLSSIGEGAKDWMNANSQEKLLNKNATSSNTPSLSGGLDRQLNPINQANNLLNSADDIKQAKKEARQKMLQGVGNLAFGSAAGTVMGIGGTPLGLKTSAVMGMASGIAGAKVGEVVGKGTSMASNAIEHELDFRNQLTSDDYSEQEMMDRFTGLTSPALQGTDFKEQEESAILAKKRWEAIGLPSVAQARYSQLTPQRHSIDELKNVANAKMYTDKNQSVLYSEDEKGKRNVLWTGQGNENLTNPTIQDVSFNDGKLELSAQRLDELYKESEIKAAHVAQGDVDSPLYKTTLNDEFNKAKQTEMKRIEGLRELTGIPNITSSSAISNFTDKTIPFNPIEGIKNKSVEELVPMDIQTVGEVSNGVGYAITTQSGTSFFQVDDNSGVSKFVGTGVGNANLGTKSMEYSPIRFEDGKALQDQVKYALQGNSLDTVAPNQTIDFAREKISTVNTSSVKPNDEVIVTVNKTSNGGQYSVINNSTGEFLGMQEIPQEYIQQEQNGQVYHVNVNTVGEWKQHYHGAVTDRDMHTAIHSKFNGNVDTSNVHIKQSMIQNQLDQKTLLQDQLERLESFYGQQAVDIHNVLVSSK